MKKTWSFVRRCEECEHPDWIWSNIPLKEVKVWAKSFAWFKCRQTGEYKILPLRKD